MVFPIEDIYFLYKTFCSGLQTLGFNAHCDWVIMKKNYPKIIKTLPHVPFSHFIDPA